MFAIDNTHGIWYDCDSSEVIRPWSESKVHFKLVATDNTDGQIVAMKGSRDLEPQIAPYAGEPVGGRTVSRVCVVVSSPMDDRKGIDSRYRAHCKPDRE